MRRKISRLLVTGGAGFIGSHFVRHWVRDRLGKNSDQQLIILDSLSYAGNLMNLSDLPKDSFRLVKGSIGDAPLLKRLFTEHRPTAVINFAAESHVDRSIATPITFIETNVLGTGILLDACRLAWKNIPEAFFLQISTDEVFGALGDEGFFTEKTPYAPRSPYSASKAGGDHLVHAYQNTFNLNAMVVHCSNNYGPYQFPEKLIPLTISRCLAKEPIPIYGKGDNVRDWVFVEDACRAMIEVLEAGKLGERYLIGGQCPLRNIELVTHLTKIFGELQNDKFKYESLISFVKDRAGHDYRYATDIGKISSELGWKPTTPFNEGLKRTVEWYLSNGKWLNAIADGSYRAGAA